MPKVVETTVYQYSELSDSAKEKAREWWLSCRDASDFDYVIQDFVECAAILGVDVESRSFKTYGGGTGYEPRVRWGLYSQGSGASFCGSYCYAKGAVAKITAHTGGTEGELIRIAKGLQAIQAKHGYGLEARISDGPGSNFYPHSGTMSVEVQTRSGNRPGSKAEEEVTQLMRDLGDWLYRRIEAEDEYQSSEEYIAEAMEANEYTFTEEGKRFD